MFLFSPWLSSDASRGFQYHLSDPNNDTNYKPIDISGTVFAYIIVVYIGLCRMLPCLSGRVFFDKFDEKNRRYPAFNFFHRHE